jgi:hypothetical protein
VLHLGLGGLEDAERADVAGSLGEHHVAGVEEEPGEQVERLLAADGHHHVVGGRAVNAGEGHHLADPFAELDRALADAVLQARGALLGGESAEHLAHRVERECADVGRAAGERHDLGTTCHGEECADLGGGHATHPPRVPIGVVVLGCAGHAALTSFIRKPEADPC